MTEGGETEIKEAVDLCLADGRLNPAAVGWSRVPLHNCNLSRGWPARKRWDFWGVLTDSHLFRLTYGATDYLGLLAISFLDFRSGAPIQTTRSPLFARGLSFPQTVGGGSLAYRHRNFAIEITDASDATHLEAAFTTGGHKLRAELRIDKPATHETLNVVIPWSATRFQFTSKQNTRPALGWVEVDAVRYPFDASRQAFGILDFGRGVWPYNTVWNWAAASGVEDNRVIGLNLGGQWTDRTGCTENGLCIDGRLHKISEDLQWHYDRNDFAKPWRIVAPRSGRIDLTFTPRLPERQRIELLVLRSQLYWALGHFAGTIVTDQGERIVLRDLLGWAEEHRARW